MRNVNCICGLVDVLGESGKLGIEYEKWKTWFIEVRREESEGRGETSILKVELSAKNYRLPMRHSATMTQWKTRRKALLKLNRQRRLFFCADLQLVPFWLKLDH
jgi:hypothetical protein